MKAPDKELILWAIKEIRELDELCRSMVPGYDPLHSEDILKLRRLSTLAAEPDDQEEV